MNIEEEIKKGFDFSFESQQGMMHDYTKIEITYKFFKHDGREGNAYYNGKKQRKNNNGLVMEWNISENDIQKLFEYLSAKIGLLRELAIKNSTMNILATGTYGSLSIGINGLGFRITGAISNISIEERALFSWLYNWEKNLNLTEIPPKKNTNVQPF